jgi:MFS family permease
MTDTPSPVPPRAALKYRDFRLFLLVRFFSNVAHLIMTVAIGWQVYDLTHDPLDLGFVGLSVFLPQIIFVLITGAVSDRFDRRRVAMLFLALETLAAAALLVLTINGLTSVHPVFAVLVLTGIARAFLGPALQSVVPLLVPREHFPNAVAWSSTVWQIGVISGPAVGGFLYGFGPTVVYGLVTLMLLASVLTVSRITTKLKTHSEDAPMIQRLTAGIRYVWSRPVILGAISLDLFAVLFGGATALLPIYARDILMVGPTGLGILRSAPALGAAICALRLTRHPLKRRAGAVMFSCVGGFGLATIVFGLSTNFWLSLAALVCLGACDMISVYVRQSLVQLWTPDAMRGRVSAVNLVFIGASNELGEFESGVTASWFGTVPAVVIGGIGTLLVVGIWSWRFFELRKVDRLEDAHHS